MAIQTKNQKNEVIPACKHCGSGNVVKFGKYKDVQRYWCKDCQRKFKDDGTLFHGQVKKEYVTIALNEYYAGMSVKDISEHLYRNYGYRPSKSVVYDWIDKFTDKAIKHFKEFQPKVGDKWTCDETVIDLDNQKIWHWNIIDNKTRFILATRMSLVRTTKDAEILMRMAKKKAGKSPKTIVTDKLRAYLDGIETVFGADTEHIQSSPFGANEESTSIIERFHSVIKERTKVMKAFRDVDNAIQFLNGFIVYYNYLRPHEALNGKTPAEKASIDYQVKSWADLATLPVSKEVEILTHKTPKVRIPKQRTILPKVAVGRPKKRTRSKMPVGEIYEGKGKISRHYFKGAKRRRVKRQ